MAARPPGRARAARAGDTHFGQALKGLSAFLSRSGLKGVVIGGVAVIARGVPRFTADVDVALVPPPGGAREVLDRLAAFGFGPRIPDAEAFANENLVVLARHEATGVDVDVWLAHLAFEHDAIRHAERVSFGGAALPVPRPTDLVIYKMVAARPKDLGDVEALVLGGADVDVDRVRAALREFDALLDLRRAEQWDELVSRLAPRG